MEERLFNDSFLQAWKDMVLYAMDPITKQECEDAVEDDDLDAFLFDELKRVIEETKNYYLNKRKLQKSMSYLAKVIKNRCNREDLKTFLEELP